MFHIYIFMAKLQEVPKRRMFNKSEEEEREEEIIVLIEKL